MVNTYEDVFKYTKPTLYILIGKYFTDAGILIANKTMMQ